jgi:fatty-acyl-CoA synthase
LRSANEDWIRALARVEPIARHPTRTLPVVLDDLAERYQSAPALVATGESLTYRELAESAHRYARWGLQQDLRAGDTVGLLMRNCPEYLAVWLGLTRLGVTVALVNTELTGLWLADALALVAPRLVVAGAAEAPALVSARAHLAAALPCWVRGAVAADRAVAGDCAAAGDMLSLDAELAVQGVERVSEFERALPPLEATALYIYTSGTTGRPKAAKVSHHRVMQWSHWFAGLMNVGASDRLYDCLPFYHSVGGVVATGATLVGGGTVIIRPRFSAGQFWRDVRDERCTLVQYIGELCRHLVRAPHHPAETQHHLRLACGNGLAADVWPGFEARFRIPRILEFYAATEGAVSLYNCEGEPGSIGRIPGYLRHRIRVELLRIDADTGEPWRDADGLCRRCAADEVGEAVGGGRFEGYADARATREALLTHVFTADDVWFRTRDLMRRDARGFFYFVDRAGEAYRWKGQNVSASQVRAQVVAAVGVLDAVIYGVRVAGNDGRAGMAGLVVDASFDLAAFRASLVERLPGFARPVFLRLIPQLPTTGTLKPIIRDLLRDGFDPALVKDPLFVDSAAAQAYIPLDPPAYAALMDGTHRL